MKTIRMERDFSLRVKPRVFVQYIGGATYERVPEFQAKAILSASAGRIVEREEVLE